MPRELTISQAADALGVTVDTVRHRLRAGKLCGHKDDAGRWLVSLADDTPDLREPTPEPGETYADLRREVEGLTADVARLQADNDKLWQMVGELTRQNGQLLARIPALPAPTETPAPEPAGARSSWWTRLWGRE